MTATVDFSRRRFLQHTAALGATIGATSLLSTSTAWASMAIGEGRLSVLSDGNLQLPTTNLVAGQSEDTVAAFYAEHGLDPTAPYTPPCNLTLWQQGDNLVLFDVGAGPNFMPTAGKLIDAFDEAGVDPQDVTHVCFTHAHPDHIWGLLDDFDDLICPNAEYLVPQAEWDYWMDPNTLSRTPAERQAFVAGARRYLELLAEQSRRFNFGEEVLPGVHAVDSSGHTPGHTAYVLADGQSQAMVVGDALLNPVTAFVKPKWYSNSDQDQALAAQTRMRLLSELAQSAMPLVGYHLPGGIGHVEKQGQAYRFVPQS